ncbi:MAG: hypothetical protein JW783_12340 [Bacteroidales bacterium]|nr:hypothetical protein [Bacteroidales bacterium]MBN2748600.1 hypothetical protein [Bacteroidales bacterium]
MNESAINITNFDDYSDELDYLSESFSSFIEELPPLDDDVVKRILAQAGV